MGGSGSTFSTSRDLLLLAELVQSSTSDCLLLFLLSVLTSSTSQSSQYSSAPRCVEVLGAALGSVAMAALLRRLCMASWYILLPGTGELCLVDGSERGDEDRGLELGEGDLRLFWVEFVQSGSSATSVRSLK